MEKKSLRGKLCRALNLNEDFFSIFFSGSDMNFILIISLFLPAAFGNSESEKWSWPTTANDQKQSADSRKDIYYESINENEKSGRIRVPTSFYNNRRWISSVKTFSEQWQSLLFRWRRWKQFEIQMGLSLILFQLSKCFLMQMIRRDINALAFSF